MAACHRNGKTHPTEHFNKPWFSLSEPFDNPYPPYQPNMDLLKLEQQRQALEANLQQLRTSLKYWQTFEAEYEGLKEELDADPVLLGDESGTGFSKLATTYDGELVNEKVVRELTGLDKQSPRTVSQIKRDIERRQEYVQKNIETIQRRFFEAEAKLEELDFAATRDRDTGLPLTEIQEELDDDDNVISSRLTQPEDHQAKLVESLRKAGLTNDDLHEMSGNKASPEPLKSAITNALPSTAPVVSPLHKRTRSSDDATPSADDPVGESEHPERPSIRKKSVSFTADTKTPPEIVRLDSDDGKKSVSFADKVAVAPAAPPPDPRTVQFSPDVVEIPAKELGPASPQVTAEQDATTEVQKDLRASFKPGEKVIQLGDDDEVVREHWVIPENESEEDAQLRREMLEYHLSEVGHVVAQIDLEEDTDAFNDEDEEDDDDTSSHFTGSTRFEDEDTPYTSGLSDEEEDEDEFGRTKRRVVADDYRKNMLEMEKRLIGNLGPAPVGDDLESGDVELDPKDVRRLVIRDKRSSVSSMSSDSSEKKSSNSKKRVSFAEDLDVATPGSPPLKAQKHVEGENAAPLTDTIAERTTTAKTITHPQASEGKVSRFKKARDIPDMVKNMDTDEAADTELGPPGMILASTLVERQPATKPSKAPSAKDLDPVAERRQLAAEYYRRRNDMIKQQGGFKIDPDEEEELGELMEERDGKLKKVSRFKAARIKPFGEQ